MASPLKFGNRPLLSSGTNPLPDTLHKNAMEYSSRVSHDVCSFLARTVSARSIGELTLQASMRSLMMLPCLGKGLAARQAKNAPADTLQEETCRVMRGGFRRQRRMNVLMGSRTPISLAQAREIYNQALAGNYRGDEQVLWNAVLRFHEEADTEEVKDGLQELLARTLPEEMVRRLKEFDAAHRHGEVDPEAFRDLFQNPDADGAGRNSLQAVVERVRDIALIDLFIANGARLGVPDRDGDTEMDIALTSGDYFLATKLKLALNYQTLKDRMDDTDSAPDCSIVAYQFDEKKMSYEAAAKKLFQHLDNNPQLYTHGALVCRHKDGRVTSRLVHSSCHLSDDTLITSVRGDLCVPEFVRQMKGMSERFQVLPRRPLHLDEPSSSYSQLDNRLVWGGVKGLQYALLSQFVENPTAAGVSGVCAALIGIFQTQDDKDVLTAEKFGRLLGGSVGAAMGVPFMGAQIGSFLINCLAPISKGATHAIAEECEHNEDAIDGLLMTGGVLYVANAAGEYIALSMGTMQALYGVATGVVMPAAMFIQNMESPGFRKLAAATVLLSCTGLGAAAVCALAGEMTLLSSAYGVAGGMANTLTSSLPTLRGILLAQGALSYCQWDVRKLLSIVGSAKNLMARAVSGSGGSGRHGVDRMGGEPEGAGTDRLPFPDDPRQDSDDPQQESGQDMGDLRQESGQDTDDLRQESGQDTDDLRQDAQDEDLPGTLGMQQRGRGMRRRAQDEGMDDPDIPQPSVKKRNTRQSDDTAPLPRQHLSTGEGEGSQMGSYLRRRQNKTGIFPRRQLRPR